MATSQPSVHVPNLAPIAAVVVGAHRDSRQQFKVELRLKGVVISRPLVELFDTPIDGDAGADQYEPKNDGVNDIETNVLPIAMFHIC